jgi:hypothetical protein
MARKVQGLRWTRLLAARPSCIPASRPRGVRAKGLAYERELGRALPAASHNPWFEFEDVNGHGYCSPDFLLQLGPATCLVLETKLRWVAEGHSQLEELYFPVVQAATGLRPVGGVVTKVLVPGMPGSTKICRNLRELAEACADGRRPVLHWLGSAPLWP